ncbi:MAG: 30S ribosomal protein S17 [Desulfobacteraceae bacterium]|nr:30S ribosomal protein S17 [Desulfobacteraceae bacterium]
MNNTRGTKREFIGTIVSNKMDKTVVVVAERLVKHRLYKKFVRRQHKFVAHDSDNKCGIGDRVLIMETRPMSKTKRWRVCRIVEKAV